MRLSSGLCLAGIALTIGCSGGPSDGTYVRLQLTGDVSETVARLDADLSLAGRGTTTSWNGPLSLPTEAVIEIREGEGELTIQARALSASGAILAAASATTIIVRGEQQDLALSLSIDNVNLSPEPSASPEPSPSPEPSASPEPSPSPSPEPTPAALSASPSSVVFSNIAANTSAVPKTVTITNTGGTATAALTIQVPVNLAPFSLSNNLCANVVLAPSDSCTFRVNFTPTTTAAQLRTIIVNGGSVSRSIALSGNPVVSEEQL